MRQIVTSVTNNYLSMIFALQQWTAFQHLCRMKWTKKVRIIAPCLTNNSAIFCPPWRKMYNRRQAADQIKRLAPSKIAPDNSDSNTSARVRSKNKASSGVLPSRKQKG